MTKDELLDHLEELRIRESDQEALSFDIDEVSSWHAGRIALLEDLINLIGGEDDVPD